LKEMVDRKQEEIKMLQ